MTRMTRIFADFFIAVNLWKSVSSVSSVFRFLHRTGAHKYDYEI